MNRLKGQLLQGPAVAVRIAEGGVQNAPEILYLADLHPPLDELCTRRLYVRDDQVEALLRRRTSQTTLRWTRDVLDAPYRPFGSDCRKLKKSPGSYLALMRARRS